MSTWAQCFHSLITLMFVSLLAEGLQYRSPFRGIFRLACAPYHVRFEIVLTSMCGVDVQLSMLCLRVRCVMAGWWMVGEGGIEVRKELLNWLMIRCQWCANIWLISPQEHVSEVTLFMVFSAPWRYSVTCIVSHIWIWFNSSCTLLFFTLKV